MPAIVTLTDTDRRIIDTGLELVQKHAGYYAEERASAAEGVEWAQMRDQSSQIRNMLNQGAAGVLCIVFTSTGVIPGTITTEQFTAAQREAAKLYDLLHELVIEASGPKEHWESTTAWNEARQYINREAPPWLKEAWQRHHLAPAAAQGVRA